MRFGGNEVKVNTAEHVAHVLRGDFTVSKNKLRKQQMEKRRKDEADLRARQEAAKI